MFMCVIFQLLFLVVMLKVMLLLRAYLVLSTFCFSVFGYRQMLKALGITFEVRCAVLFLCAVAFSNYRSMTGPTLCPNFLSC